MRNLRRMMWTAAAIVATGSPAFAQQQQFPGGTGGTGGSIGSTQTQTQSSPTTSTNTGGTDSSSGSGIPGASSSINGGQESEQQFQLAEIKQAPSKTTTNNTAINTSNFLRNTYGSVYYQGADRGLVPNRIPGSFGTAIYPATGTGTTGGARGTQQGAAGRTGGTLTDPGGQIVQLPRQIAYTSQIQFKTPAGNPVPQLQSELRGSIDRIPTNMLSNPAGVQVNVDGRNVTLKGAVKDEEEARLVEGLVRLTPGVFGIKNELAIVK